MTPTLKEFPFVDHASTLHEVVDRARDTDLIALDTEFIRERTFYPELCVLQIATDDMVAAIDCLADIDLNPLIQTLIDSERSWLLHSARQDLEVLLERTGQRPQTLIDTQIAAALLGSSLQVGLQALLEETLDVTLAKEHTRTDWSRRPLGSEAIGYAIDDVRYLIPAWRRLKTRLNDSGRLAWFAEDCARQLSLPIQPDAASLLERTKGAGALTGEQRAAGLALLAWREQRAQRRDKPRRWILSDEHIVRIAAARPESIEALREVSGLPRRLVKHSGAEIVAAIRNREPQLEFKAPPAADKAIVKALKGEVDSQAKHLGIQAELIATRKDIAMTAAGLPPESLKNGWRHEILGAAIERIVSEKS